MKEDYLEIIERSGFVDIEIIEEATYPFDLIVVMIPSDEMSAILKGMDLSMEEAKEVAGYVVSIEVGGIKLS